MNGEIPTPVAIASREELKTLPVGFYVIPSERKTVDVFLDIRLYESLTDAVVIPFAHILDELPRGVQDGMGVDICVRPDGKVILSGWDTDPEWRKADNLRRVEELRQENERVARYIASENAKDTQASA